MKIRLHSDCPPEVLHKRLAGTCLPLRAGYTMRKNARLYRGKGSRFTLMQNGPQGRSRPLRVFRGRMVEKGNGKTEITGRFGLAITGRIKVLAPGVLLVLGAILVSGHLEWLQRAIFCGAACFGAAVIIGFATYMSMFVNMENEKQLTVFLDLNIARGIDNECDVSLREKSEDL